MSLENGYSRKAYEEKEGDIQNIARSVDKTTSVEELRAKFADMETNIADKEALHSEAFDQATAENAERDAAKETAERAASEQAEAAKLLEQMRAKAGLSVEQSPAVAAGASVSEKTAAKPEKVLGLSELRELHFVNNSGVEYLSPTRLPIASEVLEKTLRETSGGLLRFDKNLIRSSEKNGLLPESQAEAAIENLARSEGDYGRKAFDYVASPETRGKLEVGDNHAFINAFNLKQNQNEEVRDKTAFGAAAATLSTAVAGMGLAATGSSLAGLVLMGALPVAAIGFGGWGAKYLYDKYRERKAVKDYSTATVTKNARSILGRLLGKR